MFGRECMDPRCEDSTLRNPSTRKMFSMPRRPVFGITDVREFREAASTSAVGDEEVESKRFYTHFLLVIFSV
jgi:hypothetical protein